MPDWDRGDVIDVYERLPGRITLPDQIDPTDDGWRQWAAEKLKQKCPFTWGPTCTASIILVVGRTEDRPVDGDNPDDFGTDGGWQVDEEQETLPPEPYRDFTRWVRHYKTIRVQRCVEYEAYLRVKCGEREWTTSVPDRFWRADGPPVWTGPRDTYGWTHTSGVRRTAGGLELRFKKLRRVPPIWQLPYPLVGQLATNETPPDDMLHPVPNILEGGTQIELPKIRLTPPGESPPKPRKKSR